MRIHTTDNQHSIAAKSSNNNTLGAMDFVSVLKNQQLKQANIKPQASSQQSLASQKIDTLTAANTVPTPNAVDVSATNTIKLGVLSKNNSTVAQLLLANPELKASTWSIIHDPINKSKPFQQIPAGSLVYYNQKSRELSWHRYSQTLASNTLGTSPSRQTEMPVASRKTLPATDSHKIVLGKINQDSPTVSHLLFKHNDFKSQHWNIIHSELNKDKSFTQIAKGSTIYIDSKSRELSWTTPDDKAKNTREISLPSGSVHSESHTQLLAQRLDDAVKPFMGTDYKDIDCYTLVVHGLKKMGVRYRGQDSLSRELLQMAQAKGRAENAFFTGEGITQAMGEKIYTRSVIQVKDIDQQSRAIYQEMQRLMQKGDLLSFSLESRGHTGVISQNREQWTYINSGRLDNSINQGAPKHGVGEETLLDEISNWIKLAQKRKESLQITLGRLDNKKFV
ncbi:MAG: hypothetical protein QNL62_09910 [Gammaproteobacteria bacterium]|nr:hypothetical protein [Gammaproteobacteria bacterium]